METKISLKKMEAVRRKCGFKNGFDVGAVSLEGDLSFGWKEIHWLLCVALTTPH